MFLDYLRACHYIAVAVCALCLLVYEKETLRGYTEPDTATPTDDLEFEDVLNP